MVGNRAHPGPAATQAGQVAGAARFGVEQEPLRSLARSRRDKRAVKRLLRMVDCCRAPQASPMTWSV